MCRELEAVGLPNPVFNNDYFILKTTVMSSAYEKEEKSHSSRANPQEIPQEKSIEDRIIEALAECPDMTRNELALKLDLKPGAIKYRLNILKKAGRIEHQGSTKAGKWVILK